MNEINILITILIVKFIDIVFFFMVVQSEEDKRQSKIIGKLYRLSHGDLNNFSDQ